MASIDSSFDSRFSFAEASISLCIMTDDSDPVARCASRFIAPPNPNSKHDADRH